MTTYSAPDPSCECLECEELRDQEEAFEIYGSPQVEEEMKHHSIPDLIASVLAARGLSSLKRAVTYLDAALAVQQKGEGGG